jgi:hypothetical protein
MATCREQHKTMPDRVVKAQALSDMKERNNPAAGKERQPGEGNVG